MANERLFELLSQALARPSGAYRAAQAGLAIPEQAMQGYDAGAQFGDRIRHRKQAQMGLKELLGGRSISGLEEFDDINQEQISAVAPLASFLKKERELKGPRKMVTRQQLEKQNYTLQPDEELLPSAGRNIVTATDPTTGRKILVDKDTHEVYQIPGMGGGVFGELTPNQLKVVDEAKSSFDSLTKDSVKQLSGMNEMRTLLNSGNPASVGIFRSQAPRVLGREVGVTTDRDVSRNTGSEALGARWNRFWQKTATGELSPGDVQDFNNLVDVIEKATTLRRKQVADSYVNRASLRAGVEPKRIRPLIETEFDFNAPDGSAGSTVANPDADAAIKWLQDNPNDPSAPAVRGKLKSMGVQ